MNRPFNHVRGENHYKAKLTEKEALEIREKYNGGGYSHADLAKEYGVSKGTITGIINRRTWTHI